MSPSSAEERKPGVKGKRIPGRPGRFDPSMPLHMTTRNRARRGTTNGTPSINGSVDDDDSQRSSTDDARPTTSHSQLSQASTNGVQIPEIAETAATPEALVDSAQSSAESKAARSDTKALSPVEQALSPSRKRKRSSPTPPADQDGLFVTPTPSQQLRTPMSDDEDAVEVIDPAQLSDRQVSETSSQSEEHVDEANAVNPQSVDDSPADSAAVSPASSVSVSGEATKPMRQEDMADTVMQMDGAEALGDAEEAEEGDEVDEQVRSDDPSRPTKKIGGKRRRGPHPDAEIERKMKRQLELRRSYRNMARDLKVVLAEIAQRTLNDLITNPMSCEEAAEYHEVKAGLDAALEERQAMIKTQQQLDRKLLEQRLVDEKQVTNTAYYLQVGDAQDAFLDRMEREMLGITRAAQLQAATEQFDTDDEDDIIPRPKSMGYRWKRGDALDPVYDSRSLPALETERALEDMGRRLAMRKMLLDLEDDEKPTAPDTFAVMDEATRNAAVARQQEAFGAAILADAASEVERLASIPIIPNEDAVGLQLLGDLAMRPSITLTAQDSMKAKVEREPAVNQSPQRPVPLPVAPPPQPETHPIEFNASPRAQQVFRERYDASMPPPRTPREVNASFAPSPDVQRQEPHVPSPITHAEPVNGLPSIAAKPIEPEHQDRPVQSPLRPLEQDRRFADGPGHRERFDPYRPPQATPWPDPIHAVTGVPDRRSRSVDERYRPDVPHRQPSFMEQLDRKLPGTQIEPWRRDVHDRQPLPHNLLHNRSHERPTSPGAVDQRMQRADMPAANRPRLPFDQPESPRSRKSSLSIKQEGHSEGSQGGDFPRPRNVQRQGKAQNKFPNKTNVQERGGVSRRHKRNAKKQSQKALATPAFSNASPAGAPPFARSPVHDTPQTHPWQPPSRHQSVLQPPPVHPPPRMPPPSFAPQYHAPPPPHFPFDPRRQEYDYGEQQLHQHRNSYPPLQPPPQLAPGWSQPPPSPLYALPSGPQHPPPPPGVPPEQYHGHQVFAPPPPPRYATHTPMTPQPPPAPGSYGQQYGGPAIAPAMPAPRYHPPGYAPEPNRLPAFAQQQRNSDGQRRRTQSDVHHDRKQWNQYYGPASGGRR